ncbi:uncharacterized protein LOC141657303 [Silene latifolia]|uniref:uncharacterized protein LOC141657303 n=1 Tax=Silene latifolia TaxID=37657 RepID=UPI003D7812C9
MDLDTENRIASILLKEAAELRRQAQQEGVLAYLHKPTVRGRPNSRFLSATIRGIEQANRVVEVNEMWRARKKELEMDRRSKSRRRDEGSNSSRDISSDSPRNRSKRHGPTCSSSKRSYDNHHVGEDSGLKDEELEEFLQSRVKRGRGSVGSRMDETGPYLPALPESDDQLCTNSNHFDNEIPQRVLLGPERPSSLKRCKFSGDESEEEQKRSKKGSSGGSRERLSKKHKSRDLY